MLESVTEAPRPGAIRRLAAGAWHVPAGLGYLLFRPRLWPRAALPALAAIAGMVLGAVAGWLAAPRVEEAAVPASWPPWMSIAARIAVWTWTPLSGLVLGLALALLLAAPLLELLQQRVELLEAGRSPEDSRGLLRDALESVRGALYFALAAPFVFVIGLIPFLGPPLAAVWAASALAFQQTDSPLARRGRSFGERRRWHSEWRPESLGFGLAGLLLLVIPIANLIAVPALAVGATRLVIELEAIGSPEATPPATGEKDAPPEKADTAPASSEESADERSGTA